jgi:hypothetical protein
MMLSNAWGLWPVVWSGGANRGGKEEGKMGAEWEREEGRSGRVEDGYDGELYSGLDVVASFNPQPSTLNPQPSTQTLPRVAFYRAIQREA